VIRNDAQWLALTDSFYSAAIEGTGWYGALEGLAAATGSRAGQLIGLGSARTVPFNLVTDLGPDYQQTFLADGGGDPSRNPIVRAGIRTPVMQVAASSDFLTAEERRSNAFMVEHAVRHDIPYICLAPLLREGGAEVGIAVFRSQNQGEIDARQRKIFATLMPHARAAVRMQLALEHQGALLMANALEALTMAAFICDRAAVVRAMTPAAETLVADGNLRMKHGQLGTSRADESRALNDAIRVAAGGLSAPGASLAQTIPVHNASGAPLIIEVFPVPRRDAAICFETRALVVVRGSRPDSRQLRQMLQVLYGLTEAETAVSLLLADGSSPEAIALARATSIGTTRAQVRSVYAKLGVRRQSELVARLNQLR